MSGFKGDFLGFTYNGVHSSDLGIVRTSDGSRFNENLLPTIQDKTVQVPGGDGTYYFGSYYTQRQFSIPFAFDGLTETQIMDIKTLFGDKKIHQLVFDEAPYKTYRAKVTGTATLKHIPFGVEESTDAGRVYRGEGTVQFTCYEPYAYCAKKELQLYSNVEDWAVASGLKQTLAGFDTYRYSTRSFNLYNAGHIDSHFTLDLSFTDHLGIIPAGKITINDKSLAWHEIEAQGDDTIISFNSKLNLIEGKKKVIVGTEEKIVKTGKVYNQFISAGEFFKIPLGSSELVIDTGDLPMQQAVIDYNYYYL